jgi:hypothetical protein
LEYDVSSTITFQAWLQGWLGLADIQTAQAQLLAAITQLQTQVNLMADVLDSIQAEEGTIVTDLGALQTANASIISALQALQAGSISTSDPRFAAALTSAQQIDASITAMTAALNAANPPPPASSAKP